MRDKRQTVKIELLSQWKLEAQFAITYFQGGNLFHLGGVRQLLDSLNMGEQVGDEDPSE